MIKPCVLIYQKTKKTTRRESKKKISTEFPFQTSSQNFSTFFELKHIIKIFLKGGWGRNKAK